MTNPTFPCVSVLIPVYNRRLLVIEAVESALESSYPCLEIIVSDNSSTDGTWEECFLRYRDNPKVRLHRNSKNIGPVSNWLSAAMIARGKYVKVLFSDDLLLDGCLEKMLDVMSDDVGFVYSTCLIGDRVALAKPVYKLPNYFFRHSLKLSSSIGLLLYALRSSTIVPVSPGAALFRKSDLISSLQDSIRMPARPDCLDTGAGPDVSIFLNALVHYPSFVALRDPCVFFRTHPASFTISQPNSVSSGHERTISAFFSLLSFPYLIFYQLIRLLRLSFLALRDSKSQVNL